MQQQPLLCEALIVDPDGKWRLTLRSAAQTISTFADVWQAGSCREARTLLTSHPGCDIVFFSFRVPEAEMSTFVKEARRMAGGNDVIFVTVLPQPKDGTGETGTLLLQGMNGVLFEPYSVQALQELSEVVLATKRQRILEKKKAAMGLIIKELAQLVDQRALLVKKGRSTQVPTKRIQKLTAPIGADEEGDKAIFFELLEEAFSSLPPPVTYTGPSERVRKKVEAKREAAEEQLLSSVPAEGEGKR